MGKAADRLREERRRTLGDWVAFCLGCGHGMRYFDDSQDEVSRACPQCGGEMRSRCPSCEARFASMFAVECEQCGRALRAAEHFGVPIRKTGR